MLLFYDYEYMWIDNGVRDDWDSLGYTGFFVEPTFSEYVWRNNTIKFFRVIPAYPEELQWVEKNTSSKTPYHALIKKLLDAIPERRCMNVKYPVVSFDKL